MTDKTKLPILVVLILLMVVSLLLAFAEYRILQKERAKSFALQHDLAGLKVKHSLVEKELADSARKVSDLQTKLEEAQAEVDVLNVSLEEEKTAKEDALAQVSKINYDLEKYKNIESDLETKVNKAQADMKSAFEKLNAAESEKAELEGKINDLEARLEQIQIEESQEQKVELGTIQVVPQIGEPTVSEGTAVSVEQPQEEEIVRGSSEGKVLVVNKDYNFVVINLGVKDGVRVGDIFSVYHNNKYAGDVKVEKLHDSMAAADFLSKDMRDKVSEGDKIVGKK